MDAHGQEWCREIKEDWKKERCHWEPSECNFYKGGSLASVWTSTLGPIVVCLQRTFSTSALKELIQLHHWSWASDLKKVHPEMEELALPLPSENTAMIPLHDPLKLCLHFCPYHFGVHSLIFCKFSFVFQPPTWLIISAQPQLPTIRPVLFCWLVPFYLPIGFYLSSLDSSSISCTCCLVAFSGLRGLPFSLSRACTSSRSMKVTQNTQSCLSALL